MPHPGSRLLSSVGIAAELLSSWEGSANCFPGPDREAVVSVDLGAAGDVDLQLRWYRSANGNSCSTVVWIPEHRLPSVRVAPVPVELLDHVAPIVAEWGTTSCRMFVIVAPDSHESGARWCRVGEFSYSDGRWWPVDPDSEC